MNLNVNENEESNLFNLLRVKNSLYYGKTINYLEVLIMNLTETLLLILVVLVSGMMLNQILEIRDLENQVKLLKKQLKNR